MKKLIHLGQFLLTYNRLNNINSNPGHTFNEFISGQNITM